VDVFDTNGNFVSHLVPKGGLLNAPWGLALAPADFGTLSKALLVGNFGDGKINGYAPSTGALIGTVADSAGKAFAVPGLWGIAFGNDAENQPHNTLFYAAGTNKEANGAYGRIDVGANPPLLNAPPVVTVTAPSGTVKGTVTVTATAKDSIAIAKVELFAGATSLGVLTSTPYSVQWDTTKVTNGSVTLKAIATDADGNVGTSPGVIVTVANGAAAATLSQIQASVFTPICSGCHNGSNPPSGALPGSQDLRTGNSFASLVGVASHEQPGVLRVKPGDPANSYIIQKLQGSPGITGTRMPFGGPYLDQATIDQIASWIASGAPNN
jgi:mono/diheme cytochrome c family protein